MDINRENYESFFIDYLDGRMSPDQVVELMSFLKENPDLEAELKQFEEIKIKPGNIKFKEKNILKRSFMINDANFDYYKKSRLTPKKITFDHKSTLKKVPRVRFLSAKTRGYVSAAASVIILFMLYFLVRNPETERPPVISESKNDTTNIEVKPQTTPQNKININSKEEILTDNEPSYIKQNDNIASVNKPTKNAIITQEVNLEPDKPVRTLIKDTFAINMTKISRKETGLLADRAGPYTLLSMRKFKVEDDLNNKLSLKQKAVKTFKKEILQEEESKINHNKFTLWDIADAGIRGVNEIIGWNMKFDKKYNDEGELTALAFNSNTISFYHSMNR